MKLSKTYWTQHTHLFKNDEYECSVCGAVQDKPYTVCPGCNSQMSKVKYDASWIDEMAVYDEIFDDNN